MTDNKEKVLDQDVELDLEEVGDKIVGGTTIPVGVGMANFSFLDIQLSVLKDAKGVAILDLNIPQVRA